MNKLLKINERDQLNIIVKFNIKFRKRHYHLRISSISLIENIYSRSSFPGQTELFPLIHYIKSATIQSAFKAGHLIQSDICQ